MFRIKREEEFVQNTLHTSSYRMLRRGVGQLEEDLCQLVQDSNERSRIVSEMQKTVLWESEPIVRKVFSGLI